MSKAAPAGLRAVQMACSHQGLDEKPIDGLVWRVRQGERRQVDLLMPELEQAVVGGEPFGQVRIDRDPRLAGSFREAVRELPRRHD